MLSDEAHRAISHHYSVQAVKRLLKKGLLTQQEYDVIVERISARYSIDFSTGAMLTPREGSMWAKEELEQRLSEYESLTDIAKTNGEPPSSITTELLRLP